eukprot:COSAG02_NODE_15015_length_1213_cov_1.809695_1_plen_31_part_10
MLARAAPVGQMGRKRKRTRFRGLGKLELRGG